MINKYVQHQIGKNGINSDLDATKTISEFQISTPGNKFVGYDTLRISG